MPDVPEIRNIDYNQHVRLVGTAHFTRRSLEDAHKYVQTYEPNEIALELDLERFRHLDAAPLKGSRWPLRKRVCEFIGASNALGNTDANIWLIDMTEEQIRERINEFMTPIERSNLRYTPYHYYQNPVVLWEKGYKQKVIDNTKRQIEKERRYVPSLWRVLIDERNTLMAARTAWIINSSLERKERPRVLAFVGAAHTDGIRELLQDPIRIKKNLEEYQLSYTEPALVRRISIQE